MKHVRREAWTHLCLCVCDILHVHAHTWRCEATLSWGGPAQNIDLVIEGTGVFLDRAGAGKHLQAGAKKVRAPQAPVHGRAPCEQGGWTVLACAAFPSGTQTREGMGLRRAAS